MSNKSNIDAVNLQGLISQGVHIGKEANLSQKIEREKQPTVTAEEDADIEAVVEVPKPVERTKRKSITKGDFESLFMVKNNLKERKTVYIAKELQDTLTDIVMSMKNREMTLGIYVENIILHHLELYKEEINSLSEQKFKKPL